MQERATDQTQLRIFTIGHSTRDFDEVLEMLRANDITALVDVRSYPSSRKFPQWNQEAIKQALPTDIRYQWIQDLGGRRHTPTGVSSPNEGWKVKAFRDYADYMSSATFGSGLAELMQVAKQYVPAIMCSEAVPWRCHRRLITDALLVAGVEVFDVMSPSLTRPANMTEFIRVRGGNITYPCPRTEKPALTKPLSVIPLFVNLMVNPERTPYSCTMWYPKKGRVDS